MSNNGTKLLEYRYTHKGNTLTFVGKDTIDLWANLKAFLDRHNAQYNESLLRNHIRLTAKNAGQGVKENKPSRLSNKPGLRQAFAAAKALVNLSIGNVVDQVEAQRRAEICKGCESISKTSDCMGCGGSRVVANQVSEINRVVKGRTVVPKIIKESYCGVCNCSLSLLTMTKISGLSDKLDDANRPDNCWMKRNGINFKES